MKSTNRSISRPAEMLAVLAIALASTMQLSGQQSQPEKTKGIVWDWTHHHVVYSHPRSVSDAVQQRLANDPRYIMHLQEVHAKAAAGTPGAASMGESPEEPEAIELEHKVADAPWAVGAREAGAPAPRIRGIMPALIPPVGGTASGPPSSEPAKHRRLHKDWSETLGPSGTAGAVGGTTGLGEFPATFTTATSCSDFAVYNNGLAGSSTQASITAYNNLYTSCGTPSVYWAYNPGSLGGLSGTVNNSVVLSPDGTQVAFVQFVPPATAASGTLEANIAAVPTTGSTVTIGSTTYTWETTASAVNQMATTGLANTGEIAQTMYAALTGNRVNCPTTNSSCISSLQTANSSVTSSFSGITIVVTASCGQGTCGNTVIFTQSSTATSLTLAPTTGTLSGGTGTPGVGGAQLVVLKWAAGGTVTNPTTLASNSSYPNCTAPCMIAVPFSGTPTDTYSSPFIVYNTDGNGNPAGPSTIYVGDDAGNLHQFTNIFWTATPSEATGGGWPVAVNANASLGSPVYDAGSGLVFIGDYSSFATSTSSNCQILFGTDPCGYLYSVNSSGTVVRSAQLDYNVGILDSPIVDSTAGMVYAFVGDDGSANCAASGVSGPCAGVFQFPAGFTGNATGTEAAVGPGYEFMMSGAFDNAYFTTGTGNLYVVGNTGPANNTLYQIPITSGVMGPAVAGPAVATNYTSGYYSAGLQISEFYNTSAGNHDYLFLSVLGFGQNNGNIACPSQSVTIGCVMGFDVTSGVVNSGTVSTGALAEQGGTSGIVVDNGAAGASNIYFSTLLNQSCTTSGGTNGCAIQTGQSAP
jgi:hypothetical protein